MDTSTAMQIRPMQLRETSRDELRAANALNFTKYLSCLHQTNGMRAPAVELFVQRFDPSYGANQLKAWQDKGLLELNTKALTAPGTTTDATWAKPLVGIESWAGGFLEVAHSRSLLGRIPGLQQIPFNAKVPFQSGDANYVWLAEGAPTPVSKLSFTDGITLSPTKALGVVVLTDELVKLSNAGTTPAMQKALTNGLNAFVDRSFLDPASTAIAGVRPGSVTSTAPAPLTGTADVVASTAALIDAFYTARPTALAPVLITGGRYAATLRRPANSFGLEVITSAAALNHIIILDPEAVFYADGGLEVQYSREAALDMSDTPTSPATTIVSLWQHDLVGFRVLRFASFGAAPDAVMYTVMP